MEVNFLNDNKVIHNSEIPIYVDVDLKEDNKTDSRLYLKDSDDEPPPVPPHEPIIQSFLQTVPSSRDLPEDKPNYLCMDGSSSIENSSYVDMTSDTEVRVNYCVFLYTLLCLIQLMLCKNFAL